MKTKDKNKFVIFVFCFIRNKKYENKQNVFLKSTENVFMLYLYENYFDDEDHFYITFPEAQIIKKKKEEYESQKRK